MIKISVPLAGLALCATGVQAAPPPTTDARSGPSELSRRAAPTIMASPDAERVAAWIAASGDNHALPYAVIDKNSASLLLYDGRGKPVA